MQLVLKLTWIVLKIGLSNVKYVTINFEPYYCKGGMTKYVLKNKKKTILYGQWTPVNLD